MKKLTLIALIALAPLTFTPKTSANGNATKSWPYLGFLCGAIAEILPGNSRTEWCVKHTVCFSAFATMCAIIHYTTENEQRVANRQQQQAPNNRYNWIVRWAIAPALFGYYSGTGAGRFTKNTACSVGSGTMSFSKAILASIPLIGRWFNSQKNNVTIDAGNTGTSGTSQITEFEDPGLD